MTFLKKEIFIKKQNLRKGLSLVETIVGASLFLIIGLAGYKAFGVLLDTISISESKTTATLIANEQFEVVRNMPYSDVGVMYGIPSGTIPKTQNLEKNGHSFQIETTVRNIDDPFDGTIGGFPEDTSPADYKLVDLDISCINCKTPKVTKFTTVVSSNGIETSSGNGALFIHVYDSNTNPVPDATVKITNNKINPPIIIEEKTDNNGWVKIVDTPPGVNAYNIVVSKNGYSQEQTYPLDGLAGPDPINKDATVSAQQITQVSFIIDKLGTLTIKTMSNLCSAMGNIGLSLVGTKKIGNPSVLKYPTYNFSTDVSGNYYIPNLGKDTYHIIATSPTLMIIRSDPFPSFDLNPSENKNMKLMISEYTGNKTILVSVGDAHGNPLDGAFANAVKNGYSFGSITSTTSGTCPTSGQALLRPTQEGTYTVTASKAGYQTQTSAPFDLQNWQSKVFNLLPGS